MPIEKVAVELITLWLGNVKANLGTPSGSTDPKKCSLMTKRSREDLGINSIGAGVIQTCVNAAWYIHPYYLYDWSYTRSSGFENEATYRLVLLARARYDRE